MTADRILREIVADTAGFDVELLGEATFTRAVETLMARRGLASRDEYAAAVRGSTAELQELLEELAVPETWFFRDRGPFEFLRDWARSRRRFLRVLSVPCSTGEEPYSIAITLFEAGLPPDRFSIDAVDISRRALEAAARALYGRSSFRETLDTSQGRFTRVENGFTVAKEVAAAVRFHRDNLVHPFFLREQGPYDVIFCRNLLIYLGAGARSAVLSNLDRLLAPEGVLVVGASELPVFIQNGYAAVSHPCAFACSKAPRVAAQQPQAPPVLAPAAAGASLDSAWRLADQGAIEEALQVCGTLPATGPAQPEQYYLMGLLSLALDRLDAAEDYFRKALYLDPDHYAALLQMSALCERRGDLSTCGLFRTRARELAARGAELDEPRH